MGSCVSIESTGTISRATKQPEAETKASTRNVGDPRAVSGDRRAVVEETNDPSRQKSSVVRCIEVTPNGSTAAHGGEDGSVTSHLRDATRVHFSATQSEGSRSMKAVLHGAGGPGQADPGNVDTRRPPSRQPGPTVLGTSGVGGVGRGVSGGVGAGSRLSGRISCTLSRCNNNNNDRRSTAAVEEEDDSGRKATMLRRQSLTQQWVALCLQENASHETHDDSAYDSLYYSNDSQQLSPTDDDDDVKMTSLPDNAPVDFGAKSAMFGGWSSVDSSDDWTRTLKDDDSLFAPSSPIDRTVITTAVRKEAWFPRGSYPQTMDRPKAAIEGRRSKPILTVR